MKTKVFSKLMTVIMMVMMCAFVSSCMKDYELTAASSNGNDLVTKEDKEGYSFGSIINSEKHYALGIRLDLGFTRIEVPEELLGKIDEVFPTANPVRVSYTENNLAGEKISRAFGFNPDGQTASEVDTWVADSISTNAHVEFTDVYYAGTYDAEPVDADGKIWRMAPHFNAVFQHPTDPNRSGELTLMPYYYQLAKGAEVVDSLIVTTHSGDGSADGNVVNVLGFTSADANVNLVQDQVIVTDASQFGVATLSGSSEVTTSDISTAVKAGMRSSRNDTFSDGQVAMNVWKYLYDIGSENHVEITDLKFIDANAAAVNDSVKRITLHYRASYSRVGNKTETGTFDLYLSYKQLYRTIVVPVQYRAIVRKLTLDGSKLRAKPILQERATATDTWKDTEDDQFKFKSVSAGLVGLPQGLDLYVKDTKVVEENQDSWWYDGTDPTWTGKDTASDGSETYRQTKVHQFDWKFKADADAEGLVGPRTQLYLMRAEKIMIPAPDGKMYICTWEDGSEFDLSTSVKLNDTSFADDPAYVGQTKTMGGKLYKYQTSFIQKFTASVGGYELANCESKTQLWVPAE